MKDLLVLVATTVIVVLVWTGVETTLIARQSFAPKNLLEISSPINGTIDTEYLKTLP